MSFTELDFFLLLQLMTTACDSSLNTKKINSAFMKCGLWHILLGTFTSKPLRSNGLAEENIGAVDF